MEIFRLSTAIYRNENTRFLLVDGDNYPDVGKILVDATVNKVPTNLQCFSFISSAANFKNMNYLEEVNPSWFHIIKARTDAKDAADSNISFVAGILAVILKITNPIALLTRDKFAMETRAAIQTISPGRDIRLVETQNFKAYLDELPWVSSDETITSSPRNPSPRNTVRPRKLSNRPSADYKCKFCGIKGDAPNSHWCSQCPNKPLIPVSKPKTGYRCANCGTVGGVPDSHWKDACPMAKRSGPISTSRDSTSPDLTVPIQRCYSQDGSTDDDEMSWATVVTTGKE